MRAPSADTEAPGDPEDATRRGEWAAARAGFEARAAATDAPEAWEGVSRAAWWQGDEDATMAARERAYRGYRAREDVCGAARTAAWLGSDHLDFRGDDAVARAWLRTAAGLLENRPECDEHGWVALLEADIALLVDALPERAARIAGDALALGRRLGARDLEVVALGILGSALVNSGDVGAGLRRLDEAAALAVGEDFGEALAPGWALCHTVMTCADVGDHARAAQWCRVMRRYVERWSARHLFGVCRTAYGGVLATHGDWPTAESELTGALEDLAATRPGLAAPAAVRLGELRARQGRLDDARRLFESVRPWPRAVVALGQLDLEAGDAEAAADAAERVLRVLDSAGPLERLPALELLARASAAGGHLEAASAAVAELDAAAAALGTPYMHGRARAVTADVLLAAGDPGGARRAAEDATDAFGRCAAPYEEARARLALSRALHALGRSERSAAEAAAARDALAVLGIRNAGRDASGQELSPRETEILRLVAEGLSDAEIAERLVLSPHTVHRHVANVRTKLRAPSRAAAVAAATRLGLLA